MKLLTEYLSTKVKMDPVNNRFPQKPVLDDIIDFLQKNGFKEIVLNSNSEYNSFRQLNNLLKNSDTPLYMIPYSVKECRDYLKKTNLWIRFANPGKINKSNPEFFLRLPKGGDYDNMSQPIIAYIEVEGFKDPNNTMTIEKFDYTEYEDFINYANSFFNW